MQLLTNWQFSLSKWCLVFMSMFVEERDKTNFFNNECNFTLLQSHELVEDGCKGIQFVEISLKIYVWKKSRCEIGNYPHIFFSPVH